MGTNRNVHGKTRDPTQEQINLTKYIVYTCIYSNTKYTEIEHVLTYNHIMLKIIMVYRDRSSDLN